MRGHIVEYLRRLKNFWFPDWMALVWLILALPSIYFFQTTIHEGTHAMAALVTTGSFPKVAPFPHKNPRSGFLNGVTLGKSGTSVSIIRKTSCTNSTRSRISKLGGFPAMPQFIALAIILLLTVIFIITPVSNPSVRFGLRLWYFAACIDFMYGTIRGLIGGCKDGVDWSKFFLESDLSPVVFALITWIFWLGILSHFIWVYWSRWGKESIAETTFWDYRWVSFILGIFSLFAVLFSIIVSDTRIIKDTAAFILPFIVQVLFLFGYWIYFGLTFKYKT